MRFGFIDETLLASWPNPDRSFRRSLVSHLMTMRKRGKIPIALLCAGLAVALPSATAAAAKDKSALPRPGFLDRSFSGDGKVVGRATGVEVPAYRQRGEVDLALGPHGEIAVARGTTVAEYRPDGRPWREFGTGGRITLVGPAGQLFRPAGIAIDSRDRLLVAGVTSPAAQQQMPSPTPGVQGPIPARVTVMRYTRRGALDPSFGQGGVFTSDLGLPFPTSYVSFGQPAYTFPEPSLRVTGIAVDGQDRPAIVGAAVAQATLCYPGSSCSSSTAYAARLTAGGSLDPGFNSTGVVTESYSQAAQPIVAGGDRILYLLDTSGDERGGQPARGAVAMRNPGGEPHIRFGGTGYLNLEPEGEAVDALIALDPAGRLLVAEGTTSGVRNIQRLRRFLPAGRPDPGYGHPAEITDRRLDMGAALAVDPRGRPLLLGWNDPLGSESSFRVGRRRADGSPDLRFGHRGVASTGFRGAIAGPSAVAVDRHGRVLVAGSLEYRDEPQRSEFAIVRFLGG